MGDEAGIRLHRVLISPEAIAETVGATALVSIPRAEVRRLRVARGVIAERPAVLGLFGLAATASGLLALSYILRTTFAPMPYVPLHFQYSQWLGLIFLAVGPAAIVLALRRGLVLFVETARTRRKLGFGAKVSADELARFVDAARAAGLDVEVSSELPRAIAKTR